MSADQLRLRVNLSKAQKLPVNIKRGTSMRVIIGIARQLRASILRRYSVAVEL